MSVVEKAAVCAACGGSIVHPVGSRKEFCSQECYKLGRAFCKGGCGNPLPPPVKGHGKLFCSEICKNRYYQWGSSVNSSYLEERKRSNCKECGKPITQPKRGVRLFCSRNCQGAYRTTEKYGYDLSQEWGSYAPETRRVLCELQGMKQMGLAKRLALAIDREYMPRRYQESISHAYITYRCKACGKQFRRKTWGNESKNYCSEKCLPKRPHRGGAKANSALTWEEVDEIRNLYENEHLPASVIREKYGVGKSTIQHIISYRSWKLENDPRHKNID